MVATFSVYRLRSCFVCFLPSVGIHQRPETRGRKAFTCFPSVLKHGNEKKKKNTDPVRILNEAVDLSQLRALRVLGALTPAVSALLPVRLDDGRADGLRVVEACFSHQDASQYFRLPAGVVFYN